MIKRLSKSFGCESSHHLRNIWGNQRNSSSTSAHSFLVGVLLRVRRKLLIRCVGKPSDRSFWWRAEAVLYFGEMNGENYGVMEDVESM